ncbi:MAG: hypothetical protein FWH20_11170, partial [Oscillospiraceae bacterium]|nr:hypothetical protein [Oscillospiraceae bacterium]
MKKHSKYIIIRNTLLSLSGGVTVFIGVYAATLPESEGGWGGLFWSGMFAISLILFCFIAYGY